jgi:GDP-4-dehydro-6-deoxy-D-mannose reductase
MAEPQRILVTGASGFVGRHLMQALRTARPSATLIACATGDVAEADLVLPLDLLDLDSIAGCIADAQPDAIVHLAAQSVVPASFKDPDSTWRANVDGSRALAAGVMRLAPNALFLFASSAEAYGMTFHRGVPLDEDAPFAPGNPYAASKAAADIALGEMGLRGLRVLRLRLFNHTGAGQSDAFVVSAFAHQVARIEAGLQEPVLRVGALERWRDFLDVRDVCAAYVAALAHGAGIAPGTAINIASAKPKKIGDILGSMISRSNRRIEIRTDEARMRPTDIITTAGDSSRAGSLLAWTPVIPWDETVGWVLDDWRARVQAEASAEASVAS